MSFADRGSHDQSYGGHHQHEKPDLRHHTRGGWKHVHRHHNTEVESQKRGHDAANSLTHGDPDNGYETQIKHLPKTEARPEHEPESHKNGCGLADGFTNDPEI